MHKNLYLPTEGRVSLNIQHNAYELLQEQKLSDIHSHGYVLRHRKSGARVLYLANNDENKVFSISFRTPPANNTGLPHILEHSVLCGSKKFPVKEPFVELVKGSLNTFLNAMTFPDKTMYPVASCNDQDLMNLMDVYMDAVFYPNIHTESKIFQQEGWSYQLESAEDELTVSGVVYNEMKGAFSSPEGVLYREIQRSLFPDNCYGQESGGDPEEIPQLTQEEFVTFHKTYYHPSNSYIYLYGDMDIHEKLHWLDERYLSDFEQIEVDSTIPMQDTFAQVQVFQKDYPISSEESIEDNTYLSYNKVIGTYDDVKLNLAFQILDYALLSAPGAPLKKALIDAGVGKDIFGSFDSGIQQPMFSIIAKNANLDQKDQFIQIIEDTLSGIVANGINERAILAGINYIEFRFREADFGSYPKGLIYGMKMMDSWLYDDRSPWINLQVLELFEALKAEVNSGYFEQLIRSYILENTHGTIGILLPKQGMAAEIEAKYQEELQAYKATLTEQEIEAIVQASADLVAFQEAEDSIEDIEKIPLLEREDISPEINPIFNTSYKVKGTELVHHEIETSGIGYMTLMFSLDHLAAEWDPYLGLLQSILGIIDTTNYEYADLFNEINMFTGGIGISTEYYTDVTKASSGEYRHFFEVKGKALYPSMKILFRMMRELMLESKLDDDKRLLEILQLLKSRLQMGFLSSGHSTAALRALSYSSALARSKDQSDGVGFYDVVKELEENFDTHKEDLIKKLQALVSMIFTRENLMVSYTSALEGLDVVTEELETFVSTLPATSEVVAYEPTLPVETITYGSATMDTETKAYVEATTDVETMANVSAQVDTTEGSHPYPNEGLKTSSQVQYVAQVGNFLQKGVPYHGTLQILKTILSYDYLWNQIRVKGGAYGCMCSFNRIGEGYLVSYRDPHLTSTLEIYQGVVDFIKRFDADTREMTKLILGTMSGLDQPMNPNAKGDRSMNLYMNHVSEEMIRKERKQVLEATAEDIQNLAPVVQAILDCNQICVVGGEAKIEEERSVFNQVRNLL